MENIDCRSYEQMKKQTRVFFLILLVFVLLALSGCAQSDTLGSTGMVIGQSYRLASGDVLNEDLTVMGGSAVLEKGSKVNGNVAILGGSLSIDGEVSGDVNAMGGVVSLGNDAVINGSVNTLGANVSRSDKSIIHGGINTGKSPLRPPAVPVNPPSILATGLKTVTDFFWRIFQAFALAALAVLVSLFALRPMERAGDALTAQPVIAGGIGLLTLIVAPALLIILLITIILSPLSLIGIFLLALSFLFGWIVIGLVTGERISRMVNQNWSGPVSAGIGTLIVSLISGLLSIIPCIGWIIPFLITIVGLGGVVLTRFGMQSYPRSIPTIIDVPPASTESR
jgi:hypothetical protein